MIHSPLSSGNSYQFFSKKNTPMTEVIQCDFKKSAIFHLPSGSVISVLIGKPFVRNIVSLLHQPTMTAENFTSQMERQAMICFIQKAARVTVLPSALNYPPLCCLYKFEFQPPHTSHVRFTETQYKQKNQNNQ